ncbi:interleukin-17 receptor A [Thalassophryne amazonica]|uniref:interleukin-17 receptor A n=1 Tax=Thalassophryne amazonica TaxID=390379 RepID=UPI0014720F45|nr:interleukin-17 receptor A [Thalassophryne amazonica]
MKMQEGQPQPNTSTRFVGREHQAEFGLQMVFLHLVGYAEDHLGKEEILQEQDNCSEAGVVEARQRAPTGPEWDSEDVRVETFKHGLLPILKITWKLESNAGILSLIGSDIRILDENTNQTVCVQFSYKTKHQLNPNHSRWTFSLDDIVVDPGHTYMVSVFNLPKPDTGDYRIGKQIIIPGCDNCNLQKTQICLENGSLWDPNITVVSVEKVDKIMLIVMSFETATFSETYTVSIQSAGFHCSKNVTKENRTSVIVTFQVNMWKFSQCEILFTIQPFFLRCKNDCWRPKKLFDYCLYRHHVIAKATIGLVMIGGGIAYVLWHLFHKVPVKMSSAAAKEEPTCTEVQERRRVLIIYSLDHPLYKNIVLKLCAFLMSKCGTEVILDLLDSTGVGVLGCIQWLDWHREQIESSSDKILILCSPGVQAKWKAMCGDKLVVLREDAHSPMGDSLTPALSLMVPHFVRAASFEKYIVAFFDGVCSAADVPSPFNITVQYKLMQDFEELFFRILGAEKHEPGRVKYIEGLADSEYCHCPSGRALYDAIKVFQEYQLKHPQWFEDQILKCSELDVEEVPSDIYDNAKTDMTLVQCAT